MSALVELKPFAPSIDPIRMHGSLEKSGEELILHFQLSDPERKVVNSLLEAQWDEGDFRRAGGLWQTTCFEAFWSIKGEKGYWEFNVSPNKPQWNYYYFSEYRKPAPPQVSEDLRLLEVESTADTLKCRLLSSKPLLNLESSLCVVVRTLKTTHYFSTHHAGAKPDFHLRESMR